MKKKSLFAVLIFCVWAGSAFAQTEESPLLPSRSIATYVFLVQPISSCECIKDYSISDKSSFQKEGLAFSVDIPLYSSWDTAGENRIKNRTIQFGGSATPMKETVAFGGWPVPRVILAAPEFRAVFEGGAMKTTGTDFSRTMEQFQGSLEVSIFHVLVGVDGFFGQEEIPQATKSLNFNADFFRQSYGEGGRLGLKLGDFDNSFIAGRYGRGYIRTEASTRFNVPGISELDRFPLYSEEFRTTLFSVEGRVRARWISQSLQMDRVGYKRVVSSPDPLRYGENNLQDIWLRTETEIIPIPRLHFVRGVLIFTKDFRDQNRLMFMNDYSSLRFVLRIGIN